MWHIAALLLKFSQLASYSSLIRYQQPRQLWFKGYPTFFIHFVRLFASLLSSRQDDRYHSFNCVCSNKEETGRAHPPLISLAQVLVVNGKCLSWLVYLPHYVIFRLRSALHVLLYVFLLLLLFTCALWVTSSTWACLILKLHKMLIRV